MILIVVIIRTAFVLKSKYFYIVIIPIVSIFLVAVSTTKVYPYVRYLFPAYPFLAVLAATGWNFWKRKLVTKILFAVLCLWYVVSTLSTFPNFLSYANEFAGRADQRYLLLTDNNL